MIRQRVLPTAQISVVFKKLKLKTTLFRRVLAMNGWPLYYLASHFRN